MQVTVCAAIPQAHPVPAARPGVRPAGSVSVMLTSPLVAADPMLLTVRL